MLIPLLILDDAPRDLAVPVPPISENLFARLIRNPQVPDRPVRERQCTEMLCSLLLNAPELRGVLFRWLAGLAGGPESLEDLRWTATTEQAIGKKRDDLRIAGYRDSDEETSERVVLWTIEVKVLGAPSLQQPSG